MVDPLTQNWLTPTIAFTVSVIGSFLGLAFAARARRSTSLVRWQWLALASLSLGGMAVWSMHFIAMMSFSPAGIAIRYNALLTVSSGVVAVLVMGAALALVIARKGIPWLLLGGLIAGIGIIAMHYMGMYSINVHGEIHHDPLYVALASAVALVTATAALWFASRLHGIGTTLAASAVMAAAVTSMHYVGMTGVHIVDPQFIRRTAPPGSSAPDLLLPLIVGLFVFLLICSLFLLLGVEEERPAYARRPVHADPVQPDSGSTVPADYTPRHGSEGSQGAQTPPPPGDDVWTRRR